MDPDANLKEQRRIIAKVFDENTVLLKDELVYLLSRLATLAQALDQWISSGGFLPREWGEKRVD